MSATANICRVDKFTNIYRYILLTKFFTKGWGNVDNMKRIFQFRKIISNRESCKHLVPSTYADSIYIDSCVEKNSSYTVFEGHFLSPMMHYLPELVPPESQIARFQLVLPNKWSHSNLKPLCLQLAGTGDHYFWRRRLLMAKPLIKEYGIASLILENPFYGFRKPANQKRSMLNNVSDIFTMGGCLVLESLALLHWCERMGFGPLCLSGISMGGHMASLAGTNWHKPIGIVPCLSWTTASYAFTQGVMSGAVPWALLENEYFSYDEVCREELKRMIHSPEKDDVVFDAGRHFVQTFPRGLEDLAFDMISPLSSKFGLKTQTSLPEKPSGNVDVFNFMRGIMDECTHLGNFSKPVDSELSIVVAATKDGYVPKNGLDMRELWPGSTVRFLDCGHIVAILFNLDVFRKAIADSLNLTARKYYNTILFEEPKTVRESAKA